jgi:hypothetical protein
MRKALAEPILHRARLRKTTPVFLVGDIETRMSCYQVIGFEAHYFLPGFCILQRIAIEIFLQVHDGYIKPDDPGARAGRVESLYWHGRCEGPSMQFRSGPMSTSHARDARSPMPN